METKQVNGWRTATIILMILCLALAILCIPVLAPKNGGAVEQPAGTEPELSSGTEPELTSWSADSAARDSLVAFVEAVTEENGADYIPVKDRIAVFDMDGTLTCETYYTYYDTMMFIEYCLVDHPERV